MLLSPIVTFPIVLLLIISSSCTLAVPSPFDSSKSPPEQAPVTRIVPKPTEAIKGLLSDSVLLCKTPYTLESPTESLTFTLGCSALV